MFCDRYDYSFRFSKELADIVHACLTKDHKKRPDVCDIIRLDCFQMKAKILKIALPLSANKKLYSTINAQIGCAFKNKVEETSLRDEVPPKEENSAPTLPKYLSPRNFYEMKSGTTFSSYRKKEIQLSRKLHNKTGDELIMPEQNRTPRQGHDNPRRAFETHVAGPLSPT